MILVALLEILEPIANWHSEQNGECRDVFRSSKWIRSQVNGGFLLRFHDVLTGWTAASATEELGFYVSLAAAKDMGDGEIAYEDEIAAVYGQQCSFNAVGRAKRWSMILGAWPIEALYMLIPDMRIRRINRFQRQHFQHEKLTSIRRPSKMVGTLIKRSCWNMVAVEQLVDGFKESNFRWTEEMEEMLPKRTLSCFVTQLIEDVNNAQKNNVSWQPGVGKNIYIKKNIRRPPIAYAAASSRGVVDRVFS